MIIPREQIQDGINDIKALIRDLENTTDDEWTNSPVNTGDTSRENEIGYWKSVLLSYETNPDEFLSENF